MYRIDALEQWFAWSWLRVCFSAQTRDFYLVYKMLDLTISPNIGSPK